MSLKKDLLNGDIPVTTINPPPSPQAPLKVMICVPSGRTWEARTSTALAGMATYSALHGLSIGIINLEGSMITKQRNDLVDMCRTHNADYILQVDSDLVFPPESLMRLLKHKKDIVGATYNKRVAPYETLGKLKGQKPDNINEGGLQEAELMPGGMMLIKMSVYDKLRWPWYYETYKWEGSTGVEQFKNMMRDSFSIPAPEEALAAFDGTPLAEWLNRVYDVDGKIAYPYWSEDLNFCRKALKAGFKIWCDVGLTFSMVHLGTQEVTCKAPEAPTESMVVPAAM